MGKYLRKPTIFEIATAFENGQEGMLHPQNDGDGYKKVYGQLNERERILTYRHPILAMKIKKNRQKAFEATSRFPGLTDGYGDAIRHCYWCALNQMDAGLNSSDAKDLEMLTSTVLAMILKLKQWTCTTTLLGTI